MREILFRAKRKDNGEWLVGNLDKIVYEYPNKTIEQYYINETHLGFQDDDGFDPYYQCGFNELVDENTICEYTNYQDKNGKRLFCGDIIQATTIDTNQIERAVVKFGKFTDFNNDDTYLGFYIEMADGVTVTATQLENEFVKERFEIIGNKFDNPELLKVQDD